jgi:choline-sulfatase
LPFVDPPSLLRSVLDAVSQGWCQRTRRSFGVAWLVGGSLTLGLAACGGAGTRSDGGKAGDPHGVEPAAVSSAVTSAAPPSGVPTILGKVDVLLVTIDTLRADTLGFAGHPRVETPTLDRLAAAGRVYPRAHAHNVVTLPSHANILTGLLPFQHGVRDNSGFALGEDVPTLATWLSAAGYATAAVVGAYPLDRRYGLARGFDLYDDRFSRGADPAAFVIAERRGDEVVAAARAWWSANPGQPRFLWAHLYDPHAGYEPPEPFASRYRDAPYLGEVAAVDAFLAPLLGPFLDGSERPALVIVTSDHGEALGEHGELTHGLFAYEPTLRVPLIVWGPGITPGQDERPARHIDIAPTVLAALGLEPEKRLPGSSLLAPAVAGDTYFEALTTHLNRGWAPLRGILRDGHKWIELPLPELYHLPSDPGEAQNLADREPVVRSTLAAALPASSAWPPPRSAVSSEEVARLRSLGYLVGSPGTTASWGPEDDPKRLVEVDRLLHQAIDAYSRRRLEEAVRLAREVIARRPAMADGYEQLALTLRQMERHDEAIATLEEARRRGIARQSVDRQLGQALAEVGRTPEALAVLAPWSPEGEPETLRAYGIALSDAGDQAAARQVLERALGALPGEAQTLLALGTVALRSERVEEALRLLEAAVAANDRLAPAWNTLGVARFRALGPRPAISAWQRAVAIDAGQFDALFNLGLVAGSIGEREIARQALGQFVRTAPPARYASDLAKARGALAELGP